MGRGNPFHHHQDLRRLRRAVAELDTFVVHDPMWTATARHADVVLPSTTTLERDDIGATSSDPLVVAMKQLVPRHGQARDDYDVLADLAARLGHGEAFTEGRTSHEWLVHMYDRTRKGLADRGLDAPSFEEFWERGELELPQRPDDGGVLGRFRADPARHPLPTASGRVQLGSGPIAALGLPDHPGHPAWIEPTEVPDDRHPFWLVSNQPATRLHSQLDFGAHSAGANAPGARSCASTPTTPPGSGSATATSSASTTTAAPAWPRCGSPTTSGPACCSCRPERGGDPRPDPDRPEFGDDGLCVHGNPNAVTRDRGTSSFAQGCSGQLCAVAVERYRHDAPEVTAHVPPAMR